MAGSPRASTRSICKRLRHSSTNWRHECSELQWVSEPAFCDRNWFGCALDAMLQTKTSAHRPQTVHSFDLWRIPMAEATSGANNGVNVAALIAAREALTEAPVGAQFKWRAACEWKDGTHSHSTVEGFY